MTRSVRLLTLFSILLFSASLSFADSVKLSRTGQATPSSYPPATTDDGSLQSGLAWPSPRFTNNGDGTMTDNLTGLVWLKDANLSKTLGLNAVNADGNDAGLPGGWKQAMDIITQLNAGKYAAYNAGHSDWRLPNVMELESLTTAGKACSSLLNSSGFTGAVATSYATSTTAASNQAEMFYINMNCGKIVKAAKNQSGYYILPVRGHTGGAGALVRKTGQTNTYAPDDDGALYQQEGVAWPDPRFVLNGDGTVTDMLTGLSWARNAGTPAFGGYKAGTKTWPDALAYVDALNSGNYLGHDDWRLPNRRELVSLVDFSQHSPALPPGHPFINVKTGGSPNYYWSSTTHYSHLDEAFYLDLGNGNTPFAYKVQPPDPDQKTPMYFVWPVRGDPAATDPGGAYRLTAGASPSGGGSVSLSPAGGTYAGGTEVALTASASPGYIFTGWSGDLSGTANPASVTMDSAKTVVAKFVSPDYTLTVGVRPQDGGTVQVSPQDARKLGDVVSLTAVPAEGYLFGGWEGDVADKAAASTTVTIQGDEAVTAVFTKRKGVALEITQDGRSVTMSAALYDENGVSGRQVKFMLSSGGGNKWSAKGLAVTGADGTCIKTMKLAAGPYKIKASCAGTGGEAYESPAVDCLISQVQAVSPAPRSVVTEPSPAVAWTQLPGATGYEVTAAVGRASLGTVMAPGASSSASLPALPRGKKAKWSVTAILPTGRSIPSTPRDVTYKEKTSLSGLDAGLSGSTASPSATLSGDDSGPLAGKRVLFLLKNSSGRWSAFGQAVTDASGVARTAPKKLKTGSYSLKAAFRGDSGFEGGGVGGERF